MKASAAPPTDCRVVTALSRRGMETVVFAVVVALLAIGGIVYGALQRRRAVLIGSAVLLVLVVATWAFFWFNPY